jgi:hypothetical protein
VNSYTEWCEFACIEPWPVDAVRLAGWAVDSATHLKVSSIASYASGLKFSQPRYTDVPWSLDGNIMVRQAMRFIKRKYGDPGKGVKFPVCLKAVRAMLPLLPGWPVATNMSHDDRLFACASVVATMAFLRGGEFLTNKYSGRPVLLGKHLLARRQGITATVVVRVPRPKNAWWEEHLEAVCFSFPGLDHFDPRKLLHAYRANTTVALGPDDPAFRMENGDPLQRDWMVSRTADMLDRARFFGIDGVGQRTAVKASSWRAGGVRSATDAGIAGPVIMALGRWRSMAWAAYTLYDTRDLQQAAYRMWWGSRRARHDPDEGSDTSILTPVFDVASMRAELRDLPSTTFQ